MKAQFTLWAFGIITNEHDEVLLVHRNDYDLWNLPWWWVEQWEAPWEAVIREVKEETGLDVEVEKLLWVYSNPKKQNIVFNFSCKVVGGKLTLNEEARDLQYFKIDDIPENTVPKQIERIQDFSQDRNTLIMKVQDGKSSKELLRELGLL